MIQENIENYNAAKKMVLDHVMCLRMQEDGSKIIVIYPCGDFPVNGVRVDNTAAGLKMALIKMEQHWMESYP